MKEKTVQINNFIGIYDNYITKEECNNAIKLYEFIFVQRCNFRHTYFSG